jgi:hypothetical protein
MIKCNEHLFSSSQDQSVIQRLKERIAQLDVENALLINRASTVSLQNETHNMDECDETYQDMDTLLKHVNKLKILIRLAHDRFGQTLTLQGMNSSID